MRKAMYDAEVGDDVYAEDPTINRLQDLAADMTGKEASLFVPSGSMGNLIALYIQGARGTELIADSRSHILHYEMTSVSSIAGMLPVGVQTKRGILTPDDIAPHIRPDIYYLPRTRMVEIEDTHNLAGGTCYTLGELAALSAFTKEKNLHLHMDGARVFNAAVATGEKVFTIAAHTETITFCISKGLGAPVGSLLCGTKEFITEARSVRKLLGGGMRQAGILAAAGIYALKNNVERLAEDHAHAKKIAETVATLPWAEIDPASVETNILFFKTPRHSAAAINEKLKEAGILCSAMGERLIRMVTCLETSSEDTNRVCEILKSINVPKAE